MALLPLILTLAPATRGADAAPAREDVPIPERVQAPPYYLMGTDGSGRLDREEGSPAVSPVYWTLCEWD